MELSKEFIVAALVIFLVGILLRRKIIAIILITILIVTHVSTSKATSYFVPEQVKSATEDKFANAITALGVVRKTPNRDVLQIYIKSCGMVDVLTNSKGQVPTDREAIEYYQTNRCVIEDWKPVK